MISRKRGFALIMAIAALVLVSSCGGGDVGNQNQANSATQSRPASSNADKSSANANTPKTAAKPTGGTLQITSAPPGASVVLIPNDEGGAGTPQPRGSTPLLITGVTPGKYTVDIEKTGYKYFQKDIHLKDGQTIKIDAPLKKG